MANVLLPSEATVDLHTRNRFAFLQISLPAIGKRTVLVVEDNPDMVYFYRRCTTGTSYRVVHVPVAQDVFESAADTRPDVIVLDVMLPDVDGWQLLSHLRGQAETRDIPIVVCSVVKEESLAIALGATAFLGKPVSPNDFVQALGQALSQESPDISPPQANNVEAS